MMPLFPLLTANIRSAGRRRRHAAPLAVTALVLLGVALSFGGVLVHSTLKRAVVRSMEGGYALPALDLKKRFERGVRLGKPLDRFYGVSDQLVKAKGRLEGILSIDLADRAGRVLRSTDPSREDSPLPGKVIQAADAATNQDTWMSAVVSGIRYIVVPVRSGQELAGLLIVGVGEFRFLKAFTALSQRGFAQSALSWGVAAVFVFLTLLLTAARSRPVSSGQEARRMVRLMVVAAAIAQAAAVAGAFHMSRDILGMTAKERVRQTVAFVAEDMARLAEKGIDLSRLTGFEDYLRPFFEACPELGRISISDARTGHTFVAVHKTSPPAWHDMLPSPLQLSSAAATLSVPGPDGVAAVTISGEMDTRSLTGIATSMLLDFLTVVALVPLFLVELMRAYLALRVRRGVSSAAPLGQTLGFCFFIGYDMSLSFIPLFTESIYKPLGGLAKEVVIGLPLSVEMFACAIGVLACGWLVERYGWRRVVVASVGLSSSGLLLASISTSPMPFLGARFFAGLGFGLFLMGGQILALHSGRGRTEGIARFLAGLFTGSICSSAIGGIIAQEFGFRAAFAAGALLNATTALVAVRLAPALVRRGSPPGRTSLSAIWNYLRNPGLQALVWLGAIPIALVLVGGVFYLAPFLLKQAGAHQSTIGRMIMLYGCIIIMLARPLSSLAQHGERTAMGGAVVLSGVGLWLLGGESPGLFAVGGAVFFIGLGNGLGAATGVDLALQTGKGVLPDSVAASIYRTLERIGQVIGPLVCGTSLLSGPGAIRAVGYGVLALGLILPVALWLTIPPVRSAGSEEA